MRYLSSLTVSAVEAERLSLPPLIEGELRQAVRELAKQMKRMGEVHLSGSRFAALPESPIESERFIDDLLGKIPEEAARIVTGVVGSTLENSIAANHVSITNPSLAIRS